MDEFEETQWTDSARDTYTARSEELIAAIRAHVGQVTQRQGHQREIDDYFASTHVLETAANSFNEAEFDWCGSFPLALRSEDDESENDEDGEDEDGDGAVLSVVGRWDYRITDAEALLAAGRRAYADTWPNDTREDAEIAVQTPHNVVSELLHPPALGQLEDADGLETDRVWVHTFVHDGSKTAEDEPFDIVHE